MKLSKSSLAVILSRLHSFDYPKVSLEQYPTDSEVASEVIWQAYMAGDIKRKVIVDLGCGTGILGIGALVLGASRVFFVEKDAEAIKTAKLNLNSLKSEMNISCSAKFLCRDVNDVKLRSDVVIENPPFGTKRKHADRLFLKKAISIAPVIYSLHKAESKRFIEQFSKDNSYEITYYSEFNLPLKQVFSYHKRRIYRIKVGFWRLERKR